MKELLDRYRAWLIASGASTRTVDSRISGARRLLTLADSDNPVDITADHVINYLATPSKKSSRATYYAHAAAFARWLSGTGMHIEFLDGVPKPQARRGTPRPIRPDEFIAAMSVATKDAAMMLRLAAYAGLRVSEISRVRGEDVTATTLYVVGKGDKPVELPLHAAIARYRDQFPTAGWWFPNSDGGPVDRVAVWRTMKKPLQAVGSQATPHQVRHLYGSALLESGSDLRTVQELLRHADLSSTQIYTQVTDARRRAAIANLPEIA